MFSDESTFRLVSGNSKIARRPSDVSRYNPQYTVKTVKHADSVMVWGAFSGNRGRGGLYFLPKNVTMKRSSSIFGTFVSVSILCMKVRLPIRQTSEKIPF